MQDPSRPNLTADATDAATRALKSTRSRCPACNLDIPAEVHERNNRIVMSKRCPAHGDFEVTLANNPRFYFPSFGSPRNSPGAAQEPSTAATSCCGPGCGCGPSPTLPVGAHSDNPFDTLSTCIALIEIVDSCNLTCPTCFASSPIGTGDHTDAVSFDDFQRRVAGVLERKGFIDILQLSGGEPTLHPEFFRLLQWSLDRKDIGYVLINTNAVRLATDALFRERLGALRRARGKFELYVQFDGVQEQGQRELRGADLRETRRRAIDLSGALGVPSTLAMVVTPDTLPHLGDALRFGLERPHCRGVVFQPMFQSGRVHTGPSAPISVGDIVLACVAQSRGLLTEADFTPLPCGDPNCHTISYLLRLASSPPPPQHPTSDLPHPTSLLPPPAPATEPARIVSLSSLVDLKSMQGFLRDRVDYRLEDLARCGCEAEPLGDIIKGMELRPESPFRIFIKPFMDAWTFDQDRIDRCCTHVIRPDGSLDSFCRYYLHGGAPGLGLKRTTNEQPGAVPLTILGATR